MLTVYAFREENVSYLPGSEHNMKSFFQKNRVLCSKVKVHQMHATSSPIDSGNRAHVDLWCNGAGYLCQTSYIPLTGENINICWSPDGSTIAVGNKDDLVTFIDTKSHRSRGDEQFKFEVNEISWNNEGDLFFLTSGQGTIHILRYGIDCSCLSAVLMVRGFKGTTLKTSGHLICELDNKSRAVCEICCAPVDLQLL